MANVEYLKKFQECYERSFVLDWIEKLQWGNIRDAQNSCDTGRRLINNAKQQAFINFAKSMLLGEYIDSKKDIDDIHSEMATYWEQEHLSLPEKNLQISNLKAGLMHEYELLDRELRFLFDEYSMLLRIVDEKLSTQSPICIFNATSYSLPETFDLDYIGILIHLIIPICTYEHKLPCGLNSIRDLVRIYVLIEKAINDETNPVCSSLLVAAFHKTTFLLKKSLPKETEYVYYLDNVKHVVSRSTLKALPATIDDYFKSFMSFSEDYAHDEDLIGKVQHKCLIGSATIKEYITLFDYYRKNAKQQVQIDNILREFTEKYKASIKGLDDGFDLYAWRTMINYLYNCRLSYLLNFRKSKPTFEELKKIIVEIEALQQETTIHNFYPYKKICEYLISEVKSSIKNASDLDYAQQISVIEELIINYEHTLNWCKSRHFYPIQMLRSDCIVEETECSLMLPSTFSKPIDYDKQWEALNDLKSELRFLKESLQMIEQTNELKSIKDSLKNTEKKYIEIGGIFVSAITFLFGTINIFTNDKASPLQMFTSTIGLGILLVIFATLLILVIGKNDWKSYKTWGLTLILIGYTVLLYFIIFGSDAFYGQLATALSAN